MILNFTNGRPVAVMKFNPMAESLEFLLALSKALVFINQFINKLVMRVTRFNNSHPIQLVPHSTGPPFNWSPN